MQIKYREEIDGLRAIAIIAILIHHFNFTSLNLITGGFLGVDIFFVISGYLITSIIFKEIINTNNFLFLSFYQRRVKRLLPALLFVTLCLLPISCVILLPSDSIFFLNL